MRKPQFSRKVALAATLLLPFTAFVLESPVTLEAQAVSGDLVGVVTDANGAVVPNATVEVTNLATGFKQTQQTTSAGDYHFTNLPVGNYSVHVTAAGLTGDVPNAQVQLNKTGTVNVALGVTSKSETVEVTATAVTIDTTTPQIQSTFETKQVQDLPTASTGSGVLNLSLLNAGVATSGGIGAGSGPSVSGQRPRNNNFTIEGVDDNNKSVTGPLITIPNDAIQNFTVLQNQFSPEFGHSSGGQFNQTVLSGTNSFHGRAYDYLQNRNLNALDTFSQKNVGITKQPRYDNNRIGGQIGGPIVKDHLFFFQNVEYNPIGRSSSGFYCAPTALGYTQVQATPGLSTTNFQTAQKYLGAAPTADLGGVNAQCGDGNTKGGRNGYVTSAVDGSAVDYEVGQVQINQPNYSNNWQYTTAIDLNLTQSDQIRFRYSYDKFDGLDTSASLPAFWTTQPVRYHIGTIGLFHTFSPTVTNEFRFGFNRFAQPIIVGKQTFPGLTVFPNLTFNDLNAVNIGPDPNAPQSTVQNTYQGIDNVTIVKGKHNLRFGAEYRKYISPQQFTQRVRGDYQWSSFTDYLQDMAPTYFGERSTGNPVYSANQYAWYGYGNDEWRITPQLSINAGLRYEYTHTPYANKLQTLNSVSNVPGLISFGEPKTQKLNFMPRFGFAYSPGTSGDTSIRGGYAMANDVLYDNLGILSLPPQFTSTCDVGNSGSASCYYGPGGPGSTSTSAFLASGGLPQAGGGFKTFPTAAAARAATSAFVPDQKLPYSETWDLGIQHIFAHTYTLEVRYVGTRGIHLPVQSRINRQTKVTPTFNLPTFFTAPTQSTLDSLSTTLAQINAASNYVPAYSAAGFTSSITSFEPWGQSVYHGLQTQLSRSFRNGLQFQTAWTWSHAEDNSTADVFSTVLTPRRAQDWLNFANEFTTSALDRRHRVTAELIYNVAFFKDRNWILKNIVSNWEVAPIYTFQSPEYVTVQSALDTNGNGDSAGDRTVINPSGNRSLGTGATLVCNSGFFTSQAYMQSAGKVACGGTYKGKDPVTGATTTYTTAQYAVAYVAKSPNAYYVAAGTGALANASRNTLATPHENNWDISVLKRVNITERFATEFGAQAYNVFNHAQYLPGYLSDVASIGYTGSGATSFVRATQPNFANAKANFSNQPRQMQLFLKFIF